MELTREQSCFRSLNWRCDLPAGGDLDALTGALSGAGFTESSSPGGHLRVLRAAEGHEIVIVPRTGRVQIRVHYLTAEGERRRTAEQVFCLLVRGVLGEIPRSSAREPATHAPDGPARE